MNSEIDCNVECVVAYFMVVTDTGLEVLSRNISSYSLRFHTH
jgi:hypothetical protein